MCDKYQVFEVEPCDFYSKTINEPFVKWIMSQVVIDGEWRSGDANLGEPDFFCDNIPFEITLASDHKRKSVIQSLKTVTYKSQSIMQEAWHNMEESLRDKCTKNYSVNNVNVCILSPLLFCDHMCDASGKLDTNMFLWMHQNDIQRFKNTYITNKISNAYLIFPCKNASWWVLSINDASLKNIQLTKEQVISGDYLCFITTEGYPEAIKKYSNNCSSN